MNKLVGYLGIDQYGGKYIIKKYPRKELLEQLGRKHADKIYIDNVKTGKPMHCGYYIAGLWIDVYKVRAINNCE